MKKALVCGAGGFIGSHLVKRLKNENYWVRGVDLKDPLFSITSADEFIKGDLTDMNIVKEVVTSDIDEVYQLAADMGGADFIFTGENDADIMNNSATINLNILKAMNYVGINKVFYSSSACIYPEELQLDVDVPALKEEFAYPGNPDSEYGWEKLFSERIYKAYEKNYSFDVRIARFHNIFGPEGVYQGGREKAPAALCRKVAMSNGEDIEVYGDGEQTRSFLYIDECIEGIRRLMVSNFSDPINVGSDQCISINDFTKMIISFSKKPIGIKNIKVKQLGVRGRNSDNNLIHSKLGWKPTLPLKAGIEKTFKWIDGQINSRNEK